MTEEVQRATRDRNLTIASKNLAKTENGKAIAMMRSIVNNLILYPGEPKYTYVRAARLDENGNLYYQSEFLEAIGFRREDDWFVVSKDREKLYKEIWKKAKKMLADMPIDDDELGKPVTRRSDSSPTTSASNNQLTRSEVAKVHEDRLRKQAARGTKMGKHEAKEIDNRPKEVITIKMTETVKREMIKEHTIYGDIPISRNNDTTSTMPTMKITNNNTKTIKDREAISPIQQPMKITNNTTKSPKPAHTIKELNDREIEMGAKYDYTKDHHGCGYAAFELINEYRKSKKLSLLIWSQPLADIAREHSVNMANGKVKFGHDGVKERFDKYPMFSSAKAENVGMTKV
eukprot:GHVL01035500.1.p1 GENE.GHVL01035500.1~~GHVL01035500.1.p1  ORF type:complete len:353 (+),score=61.65 GHVL01035500.1:26-1060(+)